MENKKFKNLQEEIQKDIFLDKKNILQKSIDVPVLFNKYLQYYINELHLLKNQITIKDRLYGELYDKFKFHYDYELKNKAEIDAYINKHPKYYEITLKINTLETQVKFLEKTIENVKNMNYNIKNYLELEKFLNGY